MTNSLRRSGTQMSLGLRLSRQRATAGLCDAHRRPAAAHPVHAGWDTAVAADVPMLRRAATAREDEADMLRAAAPLPPTVGLAARGRTLTRGQEESAVCV